ncbi:MAG: hypothetical protein KGM16_05905 [Bacteroidota bacterium]|nr:hypothetical protein [Bacteroidota bacterium]
MRTLSQLVIAFLFTSSGYSQKVTLGLHLKKGETYYQVQNSKTTIVETVNGQDISIKMSVEGKTSFQVKDIVNENYQMEVVFKSLQMEMETPQKTVQFSSDKNDTTDIFSTLLSEMTNKPFTITLTKKGKVEEVHGLDNIFGHLLDKYPQLSQEQKQQIKDQLMKAYGEKAMKGSIEMITSIFPDNPVKKGDQWQISTQLEAGFPISVQSTYEYDGSTDSAFQLHGVGKMQTADKDAYIESNGMPLKYDLSGTLTSDIEIDKTSGWIFNATITQNMKGNAEVKDNPKVPGGMMIPMTIETISSVKK